jgi:aryl-alcohol dehydrogenase-like predicted oxidoreductase
MGLGTQRWGSADFNAPDEALCHKMMDRAILEGGINLIDTAEQYPIPSDWTRPEGSTESIIGSWLKKDKTRRDKVVIASKITGGRNVNAKNIIADCEGSLRRLGSDYMDLYLLHWPARYSPQSNWGQSLEYKQDMDSGRGASFDEIARAMS